MNAEFNGSDIFSLKNTEEREIMGTLSIFAFFMPGIVELIIIGAMSTLIIVPFWMICSKAGFPGWISLAILFPVLNIVLLFFLAFAEWPALRNLPDEGQREF